MEEVWVLISGLNNKQISNFGNVRNSATGNALKSRVNNFGYLDIGLYVPVKKATRMFKIHRLVAECFLPAVKGKLQVNHIDGNKLNNHVSNLEWCTTQENTAHYFKNSFGEKCKVSDEQVLFIRKNINDFGAKRLAKLLNLDELYVYNVANGNVRKHVHAEFIREKRTSHSKPVIKMDLDGNILEKYTSMSAAAKYNDTKLKCIQRVVDNTRKSHKGFVFKHGV